MMKKRIGIIAAVALSLGSGQVAQADLIRGIDMGFVDIGHAGNAADSTTTYGAVNYNYRIATYEVTIDQLVKVRAMDNRVGDGDENYWNTGGRTVGTNAPAVRISWNGAAGFCNWLTTGDALMGAYQFDGDGNLTNMMTRAQILAAGGTFYVLPTEDEWYKAAFYTGSGYSLYANGTGTAPVAGTSANYNNVIGSAWVVGSGGTMEQNGAYDMMGNVWEWIETAEGTNRVLRGGAYGSGESALVSTSHAWDNPLNQDINVGFRVVAIPEPATALLFGIGVAGVWMVRRNKQQQEDA
jgi:formylglycine-generating enzyme required for sulfatase activity